VHRGHRGAGAHRARGERGGELPVQPGAVDHDERGARPGRDRGLVDGQQGPAVPVPQSAAAGHGCGALADGPAETERIQGPHAVGHEPDPGTPLAELRGPLEHRDGVPGAVGGETRGQAAEPGPDHHDVHGRPYPLLL
jgi:hypothetical protein